jgi:hypothetical protein
MTIEHIDSPLKLGFSQFYFTGFFQYALHFFKNIFVSSIYTPTFSIEPFFKVGVFALCPESGLKSGFSGLRQK